MCKVRTEWSTVASPKAELAITRMKISVEGCIKHGTEHDKYEHQAGDGDHLAKLGIFDKLRWLHISPAGIADNE